MKLLLTVAIISLSLAVTAASLRYVWQLCRGEWKRLRPRLHQWLVWRGAANRTRLRLEQEGRV
jgi:hypothetical protein